MFRFVSKAEPFAKIKLNAVRYFMGNVYNVDLSLAVFTTVQTPMFILITSLYKRLNFLRFVFLRIITNNLQSEL